MLISTDVMQLGTKLISLPFFYISPGRVSLLTEQSATLSSCTRIIGAPISHMRSTQ